jgi:hypothetical protein
MKRSTSESRHHRARWASVCTGIVLLAAIAASRPAAADTLELKNGYRLDGAIDDAKSSASEYLVAIGGLGHLRVPREDVARVEKNARTGVPIPEAAGLPVPAAVEDMVVVQLAKSALRPRGGEVSGVLGKAGSDAEIVLGIPGVGAMRIPRSEIAKVEPYRPIGSGQPAPSAASGRSFKTSHRVQLRNGRQIPGNLASSPGSSEVVLDIGSLGQLILPLSAVEKIDAFQGEVVLPEEPAEAPPLVGPVVAPPAPPAAAEPPPVPAPPAAAIDPALENEILVMIEELTRHRARNRTRAENRLRAIGAPAVPYLAAIQHHPFDLTRRAVLRLVRDAESPAGVPIAVNALLDADVYVRQFADEALRRITAKDLGYRPSASPRARLAAHKRWVEFLESQADAAKPGADAGI